MSEFWPERISYRHCVEMAEYGRPAAGLRHYRADYVGPEIDQWLERPTCYPVMLLLQGREDFTRLEEEGQRMFLTFAAEVLYGPRSDESLRDECYRIALEPI